MLRWVFRLVILGLVLVAVAQAVPYGKDRTNPPVTRAIRWDSAATRRLAENACMNCHSNLTTWPWFTKIAPASWLAAHDVKEGRAHLDFSEWDRPQLVDVAEILEVVREGEMPPLQYKLMHGEARLSKADRERLAAGLARTLEADPPVAGSGGRDG